MLIAGCKEDFFFIIIVKVTPSPSSCQCGNVVFLLWIKRLGEKLGKSAAARSTNEKCDLCRQVL